MKNVWREFVMQFKELSFDKNVAENIQQADACVSEFVEFRWELR